METKRVSVDNLVSLKNFIETPNCIFVGDNLSRYTNGKMMDSKWAPKVIFGKYKLFGRVTRTIYSRRSKLHFYEVYIRSTMNDQLYELYNCKLGCYCKYDQRCHADILRRLCVEQYAHMRLQFELHAQGRHPSVWGHPTLDDVQRFYETPGYALPLDDVTTSDRVPALEEDVEEDVEDDYDITIKHYR